MMRTALLATLLLAVPATADESAWTLLDKGVKAFQKKDWTRAEAYFRAAQNQDGKCYDASYYLGQIHARRGKFDKAAAELKLVPEDHSLYPLAQAKLGQLLMKQGRKKEALACLVASVERRESTNMWLQVANVQIDLKKYKEAGASLEAAEKLSKGDFRVVEMRGRLYVETRKFEQALAQYDKLVEKFHDDFKLHNMRGLCLMELDRGEPAARSFERVLKLYPYHKGAMRNLIRLWEGDAVKAARVEELRETLERIEKYPPNIRKVKR